MKKLLLGLLLLALSLCAAAQLPQEPLTVANFTPAGSCSVAPVYKVSNVGLFQCIGGHWTNVSGSSYPGVTSDGSSGLTIIGALASAKTNGTQILVPSGDTTGVTDQTHIAALLAGNYCIHAIAGQFYYTGNISVTAPVCLYGDGPYVTFFNLTNGTHDLFDGTWGGGGLNNESYGSEIHSFTVRPASGVTPTAGYAFSFAGVSSSAYMSGVRLYNVDMWGLCGGVKTGSYMVSNWIVNNHLTNFVGTTGCHGIYMNTPTPGGDFHWDGDELTGSGTDVLIHQSDVQEISGLKLNLAGITFDNSADRVSISNTSIEGGGTGANTPNCGINFTGTAANLVQISFEGKIDLMPHAFCANSVGTLNPSGNVTQFSYNANLNQTNDGITGRVVSGQAQVNPLTFQIANAAPSNYCPVGNGSSYVGALCPGAGLVAATAPVFSPAAGNYANTQTVTITCASGSAYYSVGGGTPMSYSGALTVSSTETIAAGCFGTGYTTAQASATYTIAAYQTQDLFAGTTGTLLSAHTDLNSHTWAVWPYDTTSGDTIQLSGSGYAWDVGTSVTHNAAYLNSLSPASANYTVAQTFAVVSNVSYGVQVFARASSGAATSYLMICASSVAGCQIQKLVSGTDTNIGSPATYSLSWANNASHTLSLYANGTALTGYVDGVAVVTATDSSITATGQSGFGLTANSNVKASNFTVQ